MQACGMTADVTDDDLRQWLARQRLSLRSLAEHLGIDNPAVRSTLVAQMRRQRERQRFALDGRALLSAEVAKDRRHAERWDELLRMIQERERERLQEIEA